jgi:hypothetical protein
LPPKKLKNQPETRATSMVDATNEYLYHAIDDIQSTIRAIDNKLHITLAFLVIPFSIINKVALQIYLFVQDKHDGSVFFLHLLIAGVFFISWMVSLWCTLLGLRAIFKPQVGKKQETKVTGSFFLGDIITPQIHHLVINAPIKSNKSLDEIINNLPEDNQAITKELSSEQIKLAAIRNLKAFRHRVSFSFLISWLISGIIIYCTNFLNRH